jgi:hypothetical protein
MPIVHLFGPRRRVIGRRGLAGSSAPVNDRESTAPVEDPKPRSGVLGYPDGWSYAVTKTNVSPAIRGLGLLGAVVLIGSACGSTEPSKPLSASPGGASPSAGASASSPAASPAATRSASPSAEAVDRNPGAFVEGQPYEVTIDPADFVGVIDNPYMPLKPGTKVKFGGAERIEITITTETKTILGVPATVVRDQVFVNGELEEDTFDWFAQDRHGNVWYFGEKTAEYANGKVVSTAGSWEGGVDGARPGIVMLADPQVGDVYRQEYYKGEAEDLAEVTGVGGSITVPLGTFTDILVTEEWTPLEPSVRERKT